MRRLQRTISEIGWTRTVPLLSENDMVARARELMSNETQDCVLITRGEKLVGIFTSRDFLNRVVGERRDVQTTRLGDIMSANPRTLQSSDPIAYAINWMALEAFRNVPIVDDEGVPLGVLTAFDVLRALTSIIDEIVDTQPERLQDVSSISKVFDVGGGD